MKGIKKMNVEKLRNMILMILPLWVVGCTQGQESFSTEPGKGYGWKDMTETHAEIHHDIKAETRGGSLLMNPLLPVTPITQPIAQAEPHLSSITRVPEHFMRIWFAPYQDHLGNLHEECAVHTVMQSGQWNVPNVQDELNA